MAVHVFSANRPAGRRHRVLWTVTVIPTVNRKRTTNRMIAGALFAQRPVEGSAGMSPIQRGGRNYDVGVS